MIKNCKTFFFEFEESRKSSSGSELISSSTGGRINNLINKKHLSEEGNKLKRKLT